MTITDYKGTELEKECINTIRIVSAEQPESAKSGHPGAPMGCAPIAYLLWSEIMKYSATNPKWMSRDRFILSNGHACALQYTMLHLSGYNLSKDDLSKFRQLESKTPGHPECFLTEGIEVCSGPLGQGISNAVGLAMAETHLAATYNTTEYKIFDNYTYVLCGDGCLQEGVASEASSLAGHLQLGKLIVLYDDNNITIDGPTDLSFTEDVMKRYDAYGWHTQTVENIDTTLDGLRDAIKTAQSITNKPSIIAIKTIIGYGAPNKQNTHGVHGAPLGTKEMEETKKIFGLNPNEKFVIPPKVQDVFTKASKLGESKLDEWQKMYDKFGTEFPEKVQEIQRKFQYKLPETIFNKETIPKFVIGQDKNLATRKMSEACLNSFCPLLTELIGGSADLTPSNNTRFKGAIDYEVTKRDGRYIRFGVREHGMAAISNGLYAYGGLRPFCATFLVFTGYALGSIRVSALSKFGVLYIMTHDSIGLGEDGPTHQPVETLETLRSLPNLYVMRPADMNEMIAMYKVAIESYETPSVLCCSRQTVPGLYGSTIEKAEKGAYIVLDIDNGDGNDDTEKPDLILVATGSEVGLCVDVATELLSNTDTKIKARVVSMPCQELFEKQSIEYKTSILPGTIPTLSVEASCTNGWHKYSHAQIGMKTFGSSGPGKEVMEHFGFSKSNVTEKAMKLVDFYKTNKDTPIPNLNHHPIF